MGANCIKLKYFLLPTVIQIQPIASQTTIMALTTSAFNTEHQAADILMSMHRDATNLSDAAQGLMAMNQNNEEEPNPEHEFADAFAEYAQANGLWGLPGSERIPTEEETRMMRDQFYEHWANMHIHIYEEEHVNNIDEVMNDQTNGNNYENFDPNTMFIPECAECGVPSGENVPLIGCVYDDELYCTGCMDAYSNGGEANYHNDPVTWSDITIDFQDFIDEMDINPTIESADQEYLEAWESYVQTCWHPLSLDYIQALGEDNNWIGVRPRGGYIYQDDGSDEQNHQ